jgi:hypothetical protein
MPSFDAILLRNTHLCAGKLNILTQTKMLSLSTDHAASKSTRSASDKRLQGRTSQVEDSESPAAAHEPDF